MKQRFFVQLQYDGSAYAGWQRQPDAMSVQQRLDEALSLLLRSEIETTGAGRTDAGVHARQMIAHFDVEPSFDCTELAWRVNRVLPKDIAVERIWAVADDMHARFSARRRTYRYYVHLGKDAFIWHHSLELHGNIDFLLMNKAACRLLSVSDFAAFAKTHTDVKTTICRVEHAQWHQTDAQHWYFEIAADRFLRNMVRAIVGTLLNVGRGKISIEEFDRIVNSLDRSMAGDSAPAHALFLEKIEYE